MCRCALTPDEIAAIEVEQCRLIREYLETHPQPIVRSRRPKWWVDGPRQLPGTGLRVQMDAFEREVLREALASTNGNVRQAAIALGVPRTSLVFRLESLGMKPPRIRVCSQGRRSCSSY